MAANTGLPDEKLDGMPISSPAPKSPRSALGLMLSGINLLGTFGMLGVLVFSYAREKKHSSIEDINRGMASEGAGEASRGSGEGKSGERKKVVDYGRMITLDQFTVNL